MLAEHGRDRLCKFASGCVPDGRTYVGSAAGGVWPEFDRAAGCYKRVRMGLPRDSFVLRVFDDFGVPADFLIHGAKDNPFGMRVIEHVDGLHVSHETGQVREIAPEAVSLFRRSIDEESGVSMRLRGVARPSGVQGQQATRRGKSEPGL